MSATLEFFFDFRSPYAYLANTRLPSLGAKVAYRPFEIRGLMEQVGNVATSIHCKPKNKYLGADLARWVKLYGVPFQRHPDLSTIDARRLLRAALAADEFGQAGPAVTAILRAVWGVPAPLATASEVAALVESAGVNAPGLAARMDDPALDAALDRATADAIGRGVFGAPTMFVGEEMFFGNDRFDFVRDALAGQEVA